MQFGLGVLELSEEAHIKPEVDTIHIHVGQRCAKSIRLPGPDLGAVSCHYLVERFSYLPNKAGTSGKYVEGLFKTIFKD